jgi:hypothetical protein
MAYGVGINKQVRVLAESTYGTAPAAAGAAVILPRVQSTVTLTKQSFKSAQIQADRQYRDFRHGIRVVSGGLDGEVMPGIYSKIMNQIMGGTFTAGVSAVTPGAIAAAAGPPGTFTRTTGSWISDGFKVGDIVRFSGYTTATANNARNYRITALTATVLTTSGLNNEVVGVDAGASVTCSVVGKKLIVPQAGSFSDQSFSLEHWYPDAGSTGASELFTGCKADTMAIALPASGMGTAKFTIKGQQLATQTAQYFTSATYPSITGVASSVSGTLRLNGVDLAYITAFTVNVNGTYTTENVVGALVTPGVFPGLLDISGTFTALFADTTIRDLFLAETEVQLNVVMTINPTVNSDFINLNFPRVKINQATKDDKPGALMQSMTFQALNQINGGTGTSLDFTTLSIQDSLA